MDTDQSPRRSATPAKAESSSLPTVIFYGAVCLAIFAIGQGHWGFLLVAALIMLPFGFLLIVPALTSYLGLRNMYRHPELYSTKIIEDEQGKFVSISWNRIR